MNLGNLIEIVVYHLLIEGIICLDRLDGVPMVSALVCVVIHWIELMVNHDISLLNSHDSPSYYVAWSLNLKRILSLC